MYYISAHDKTLFFLFLASGDDATELEDQGSSEIDDALPFSDAIDTGDPERPYGCSICRFVLC